MFRSLFLTLAVLLSAAPTRAQVLNDPEDNVVEGLIVESIVRGPPWWKAEKNGRMVYIMGLPTTVPRNLKWDQVQLDRRLDRAQRIIIPAQYKTDTERKRFDLDKVLTPELRARIDAAAAVLGKPATRYQRVEPMTVAARLSEDFADKVGLEWDGGYDGYLNRAGLHLFTRKAEAGLYGPKGEVDMATQLACLSNTLDAVEAGAEPFRKAAEAWAVGDIRGSLSGPRGDRWWRCAVPSMDVIVRYVNLIEDAVATPGVEVVVAGIPVHSMVAKDGVVERLEAAGYKITDPAGLEAD
jgi:hypothetical protein